MKSKKLKGALQKFNQKAPKSSDFHLMTSSESLKIIGGAKDLSLDKDCGTWGGECSTWSGDCGTWG